MPLDEKARKLTPVEKTYAKALSLINEVDADLRKAVQGNKAAGRRARAKAQEIKKLMTNFRKETLELNK